MSRQSQNVKARETTAILYLRLSRDDGLDVESNSITSQKKLLNKTARDKGYANLITFVDDGISGVTMNRPGFNAMIDELKKGYVGALFVKDAYVKLRINFSPELLKRGECRNKTFHFRKSNALLF